MYGLTAACSQALHHALAQSGVAAEALAELASKVDTSSARVKASLIYDVFDAAVAQTGNADLGLLAYGHAHPAVLKPFGYYIMSGPTLGCALERLVECHPLISSGSHMYLERGGDHTVRLVGLDIGESLASAPRAFIDAGATLTLGLLHWLVPYHKPMPLAAEFTYPKPANIAPLRRYFGNNLTFSAPANSLVFDAAVCDIPLPTADDLLDVLHREHAHACAEEILSGSVLAKARRFLLTHLAQGKRPAVAEVAQGLGISTRSLQHALEREGSHFSSLLDACRQTLAHNYLKSSERSIKHIGALLGFSDQSSFNKACIRWFGLSPNRYRQQTSN